LHALALHEQFFPGNTVAAEQPAGIAVGDQPTVPGGVDIQAFHHGQELLANEGP
jgi:hypothetical protein